MYVYFLVNDQRDAQIPFYVKVTGGCIDTICLSWWWAGCARNV